MAIPVNHPGHTSGKNVSNDGFSDIRKIVRLVIRNWYLFVIFIPLGLGTAYIYHHLTVPVYRASITMIFKVDQERSFSNSVLTEGFGLSPEMRSFENQSFIIRSHAMVLRAINRLDFGVSYYSVGRFKNTEIYDPLPFVVRFDSIHPQLLNANFEATVLPGGKIELSVRSEGDYLHVFESASNSGYSGPVSFNQVVAFGEQVTHPYFSFTIDAPLEGHLPDAGDYMFRFNSHSAIASGFRSSLSVSPYREGSSIIFISTTGQQPQKLVKFLNTFSEEVIINNLERKNDMANRSIEFIQRQLAQVSDTLKVTQQKLMDFRRENRFMMPSEMSSRLSEEFFEQEKQRRMLEVSYGYFVDIKSRLVENNLEESDYLLPAFSNEPAAIVQQFVRDHLELLKEQSLIAGQAGRNNPYQVELEKKITLSQQTLLMAVDKQMESIQMQQKEIDRQTSEFTTQIGDLPELERDFLAMERTHKLNDAIYTFLLQKSSEMQIAKASNVPDNEVLDQASVGSPISPTQRNNYSKGLMAGLIIPALIIAFKELFNTRIRGREDIDGLFKETPIVGEILRSRENLDNVVLTESNSVIAESFRSLRARLRFLLAQNPGKVISVTSTNTGDGKTFCAVNLASVFSISGKKTALVGFDLRKPRLSQIFGLANLPGISNYLIGQVAFDDIVKPTSQKDLFVIPAGVIPPNPSELISSEKTAELFKILRENFDIIIVDTPPVGLVSDGRLLMDLADCHLFVVRAGVTEKEHFAMTLSNLISEKVSCIGVVLNDVTTTRKGYGYYSSGYFN
jgi:capsular exopolysaccharide synthesis family protein